MPLGLRRGTVTAVTETRERLVRLEVDGIACVAYPRLTGSVEVGDEVVVNEQARLLGLGSGGFDVLYANLTRGLGLEPERGAHVMALPYTPGQVALRRAEEEGELTGELDGRPVVLCTLHSQLAPVCAALAGLRVAYLQVGGGALPVSLSDTVVALKERGLLEAAVAVAPCLDGDVDVVSVAARPRLGGHAGERGDRLRSRSGNRRHRHRARPRSAGAGRGRERRRDARWDAGAGRADIGGRPPRTPPGRLAPRRSGAALRPRPSTRRRRRGRRGLGAGVRRPAALPHGARPRRGSGVLPGRLRRRASRRAA